MRPRLDWIIRWVSRYRVDLLVMISLAALNLPLLLSVPYQFNFDTSVYLSVALNFASGRGFTLPSGYPSLSSHPILFPLIFALFIKITHGEALPAVWMVKIFAVPTVWVIYALGKRLFSRGAGVLGAVIVSFSLIFRESYNYAFIDTISTFFLSAGLLFMWFNYERRGAWLILSGLSMGLSFLQKETTLFWAPIPWLLFFIDWRYRRNVRLIDLWAYTAIVAIPVAGWMLWSYHWVGQMYPMSKGLTTLVVRWGGYALAISVLVSYVFYIADKRLSWFTSLGRSGWLRRWLLILLLGAVVLISPLLTLFQHVFTGLSLPWIEIPAYIAKYNSYFPAFGIIATGCITLVMRAIWNGDPVSIFGTLALAMGFPLLSSIARTGSKSSLPPRQVMGFIFIAYLLFVGTLFGGLGWLQRPQKGRFGRVIYMVGVLGILGFALWFVQHQNTYFHQYEAQTRQREESPHVGWFNNRTIAPVAAWVKDNLPPGTPLLTSYWISYPLAYQTDGHYPIFAFPMVNMQFDSSQPSQPFVPGGYSIRAYYPVSFELEVLPEEIIYLDYFPLAKYYYCLMEKDIFAWVQDNRIEYLILAGDFVYKSTPYIDYFSSHPAFELVGSRRYQPDMPVYIFQVNHAKLRPQGQYPTVMSPTILEGILSASSVSWDVESIADYFPRGLSLRPLAADDSDLAVTLARHYLKSGRFLPAYNLYKEINAVAPGYFSHQLTREAQEPNDNLTQCVMYLVTEQLAQATAACNHATTLLPESSIPYVALGEIAIAQNQPGQAIMLYRMAATIHPDGLTLIRLGDAYRLSGQFEEAREAYQQAVALEPTNQIAQIHLAETDALLAQAKGQQEVALRAYRGAIDLYPGYWSTTLSTDQEVRQAIKLYRDTEFELRDESASNHVFIGNIHLLLEEWGQAVREYREALTLNPGDILAYLGLARAYQAQGKIEQAIAEYKKAIAASPDEVWLRIYLAQAYENLGKIEQAITEYEKAVAISPDEIWPRLYLAEAYVAKGKMAEESEAYEKAITAYRLAFSLAPDNPEIRDALVKAYLALGEQYFDQDSLSWVIAAYEKDIELGPNNPRPYWKLAEVYEALGQMDEAMAVYARVVASGPDSADAHFRLGQAHEAQGDIEAAMAAYEKAIELEPTFAGAYIRLGNIYKAQDRAAEAIALYRAASKRNPDVAWPHIELGKIYLKQASLH